MLSKLAFRNMGKGFRDYAIYFFTLVIGVCVFYMFNSIYAQQELMTVTQTTHQAMQSLQEILSYISVFVAIVLGFLIIYANRFFMKRRKKELGIYMTLGMSKGNISTILVLETSLLAIAALGVGLLLGVFGSQFMSVFTAKIFEADMSQFRFIFSFDAVMKSIFCFGIIFIVVMLFNVYTVGKCKLIDLIYAGKQNENMILPKPIISVSIFVVSIVCFAIAYFLILKNGILELNIWFLLSIVMGAIGTVLFFFSLSGILIQLLEKNKKFYFQGLNMFVVRQMGNKINTNFLSVSVVCIVLLLTIGIFSGGYSMQNILSTELKGDVPYDFSLYAYGYGYEEEPKPIFENLSNDIKNYDGIVAWDEYDIKESGYTFGDLQQESDYEYMKTALVTLLSLSEYNEMLAFLGEEPLSLKQNHYAILCTNQTLEPIADDWIKEGVSITLAEQTLLPMEQKQGIVPSNNAYGLILIVDDSYTETLPVMEYVLNIQCKEEQSAQTLDTMLTDFLKQSYGENNASPFSYFLSKTELYESSITTKAMVSFLAIYLGFVFMIVCASILAIQQLSEAADNKERYELLKKLGAEEKMINKALFTQILCYFSFPLLLAIVHAVVGLTTANDVIQRIGEIDATKSIFATSCFVICIYGFYFVLTYMGSKAMLKEK